MLKLGVISLLPEMFHALNHGITKKALSQEKASLHVWNPRDWAERPYCQVDDTPYGGGPGMVMRYEPVHAALQFAKKQMPPSTRCIYMSPQGKTMNQSALNALVAAEQPLLFLAGRYEGVDERIIQSDVDEEWSMGDFVLSGGELAIMIFIDAMIRLIPGVLGNPGSAAQDSFMNGLLDHPHYTKPACVDGMSVPSVLLEGNHRHIEQWRRQQALGRTWLKRPELLNHLTLTEHDQHLLNAFKQDWVNRHPVEGENQ
jgi:tRNA (guanine37-N1)-methyltransferase